MFITISVSLADLIIAPEQDIDLTAMPEPEAVELIRQAFSFL